MTAETRKTAESTQAEDHPWEATREEAIIKDALAAYRAEEKISGAIQELFDTEITIMTALAEEIQAEYQLEADDLDDLCKMLGHRAGAEAFMRSVDDPEADAERLAEHYADEANERIHRGENLSAVTAEVLEKMVTDENPITEHMVDHFKRLLARN